MSPPPGSSHPARRPTLRDVARLADVSPATVSKAVNDRDHVSAATRERVLAAARAVGFVPRRWEDARPVTLGVLAVGIDCRHLAPLVHAVAEAVERAEAELVVVARGHRTAVADGLGDLLRLRPDAVMVLGHVRTATARVRATGVPLAVVETGALLDRDDRGVARAQLDRPARADVLDARVRAAAAELMTVAASPKHHRKRLRSELSDL